MANKKTEITSLIKPKYGTVLLAPGTHLSISTSYLKLETIIVKKLVKHILMFKFVIKSHNS